MRLYPKNSLVKKGLDCTQEPSPTINYCLYIMKCRKYKKYKLNEIQIRVSFQLQTVVEANSLVFTKLFGLQRLSISTCKLLLSHMSNNHVEVALKKWLDEPIVHKEATFNPWDQTQKSSCKCLLKKNITTLQYKFTMRK